MRLTPMSIVDLKLDFKRSRPLDVIAVGNANIDITLYVNRVPGPDEAEESLNLVVSGGGAASNFAIAASRMGCRVGFIGCIGSDDYGKLLLQEFKSEGVDVSRVQVSTSKHTGLVLIIVEPDGTRRMIAFRGANLDLDIERVDDEYFKSAKIIHIASIKPEMAYNTVVKAVKTQTIISYDPGSIAAKQGLNALKHILEKTTILFLNQRELEKLVGSRDVYSAIKILDLGVKIVALKMGEKGSILLTRNSIIHIPPYKPKVIVDTTGAGDVYAAALISSIIKGRSLIESGLIATIAAGLKVSKPGARKGLPYESEVYSIFKSIGSELKRQVVVKPIQ